MRILKKLAQTVLDASVTEIFNGSGSGAADAVEVKIINFVNTSTVDTREITLYSHGNTTSEISWIQELEPKQSYRFILTDENAIFETVADKFYCKQDAGTDVNILVYGIEVS